MPLSRAKMREYQQARRRKLGVKPMWKPDSPPQKPPTSLRMSDPRLYGRLYMRWWRRSATCDGANEWWK